MAKIPLTRSQLEAQLADQLDAVCAASRAYDEGSDSSALHLAVSLRVLFHNGRSSRGLLAQLELDEQHFPDSRLMRLEQVGSGGPGFCALIMLGQPMESRFSRSSPRWVPRLSEDVRWHGQRFRRPLTEPEVLQQWPSVPTAAWWQQAIYVDQRGTPMSREWLVRCMADQDGGAHVDPSLTATYHALRYGNHLGIKVERRTLRFRCALVDGAWIATTGEETDWHPLPGGERAAVRQIAHEVLVGMRPWLRTSYQPRHPPGLSLFALRLEKVR